MSKTKTILYARTSTTEQNISLDAQTEKMQAYAKVYDLEIVGIEVEQASAKSLIDRPVLKQALEALANGSAEALLVVKLDRLTRSVRDLGCLMDTYFAAGKYSLISVSENIDTRSAAGRLVLNVLASVAAWEREAVGERTSAALQHLKRSRKRHCRFAPFGFAFADGEMVEDTKEQAVIHAAREIKESGNSYSGTAKELSRRQIWNRAGGCFTAKAVINMLKAA